MQMIRRPVTQLQILLVLAIALGGGGIVYGLRHMVIQLAALLILACNSDRVRAFVTTGPRGLVWLLGVTMALPLLQVVPLPAALWQALPGRELVAEAYQVAGIPTDSWFTFSVDPLRTFTAFCATLAPTTMIVIGWSLTTEERATLANTLVVAAMSVLALGIVQVASANTAALFQNIDPDPDVLYGTFSNRNSTGLFFVIAALLLAVIPLPKGPAWTPAAIALGGLFVIAVVLTRSRSSMALLVVLLGFVAVRPSAWFLHGRRSGLTGTHRRVLGGSAMVAVLVVGALGASIFSGGRAAGSIERFSQIDDDRLEMWDDGAYVAERYWPLGAGTGTFDEVFQIDESLEYVSPARAGRAHNDYIELTIELGALGVLLILAWFVWIALATWRRRSDHDRWLAFAAYASFIAIALQSMLDYPLRNQALLSMAAVLVVLLLPSKKQTS